MYSKTDVKQHERGFVGTVSFAKPDDRLDDLLSMSVVGTDLAVTFEDGLGSTATFAAAAEMCALAESQCDGAYEGIPKFVDLLVHGRSVPGGCPLSFLDVAERKVSHQKREQHEWYVCLEKTGVVITYHHGRLGRRRETHALWSTAFAKMSLLLSGFCSWKGFGDFDSRRSLLGKGQFYWIEPGSFKRVPVDNFVFVAQNGVEITIAGVSDRAVLSWEAPSEDGDSEWHDDYASALCRFADILDGIVDVRQIGSEEVRPVDETMASQAGSISRYLSTGSQFVVKSIYEYQDVLRAPELIYVTEEGRKVKLVVDHGSWSVRVSGPKSTWGERKFRQDAAGSALRTLASVLDGSTQCADV